jgi:tetratricopeptide (TPR) repeat protein/Mrp family chromosome partitioning ATPase
MVEKFSGRRCRHQRGRAVLIARVLNYSQVVDSGLLWTVIGSVTGVVAAGLAAWQVRLQLIEHRQSRQLRARAEQERVPESGGLSVALPTGRLPADVRGRDDLLAELRQSLGLGLGAGVRRHMPAVRIWILAGMGGLGKSTVALATAQAARAAGWWVWWVNASDSASLTGGMLEVLGQLGAPESVLRPVREGSPTAADRAWEFLNGSHRAGQKWLLVLDNADHPAVLAAHGSPGPADHAGWVRPTPNGAVIVTTRVKDRSIWGRGLDMRELTPLDSSTSAQMLADLAPDIDDPGAEQARQLGRRLGGLPLALHLAGSYLASPFARWHTFADYRRALDGVELPVALADLDDSGAQARAAIHQTWELSLDALAADGTEQARPLLSLLSCYAPATAIPAALLQEDLLAGLFNPGGAQLRPIGRGVAARQLRRGLQGLSAVGLIDIAPRGDNDAAPSITVHPVVADVNRSRLLTSAPSDLALVSRAAVQLLQAFTRQLNQDQPADWPTWLGMVPHLAAMLDWLAAGLDEPTLADLTYISGPATRALRWTGNSAAAEKLAESAVAAAARLGGAHPAALTARHSLAQAISDQGRDAAAEAMYRELLLDQERVLGPSHAATLATRNDLAWTTECLGRYREAETMFRQLLDDEQQILGHHHAETLATKSLLARMAGLLGRYREAEELGSSVLADQEKILGNHHPETLTTRHNLAWMIGYQGRWKEAEHLCGQVLAERQQVLGDKHPSTLTTRLRHARMLFELGQRSEAERLCRQVLSDRQRILGDTHPATLTANNDLGRILGRQGRYADAELILRQVLTDRLQIMSNDHPFVLITRSELAWVIGEQGRLHEAELMLTEAANDRRRVLGEDHPDTFTDCFRLAAVFERQGRAQEARELYDKVFIGRRRTLGQHHPDTVTAYRAIENLNHAHNR